VPNELTDLPDDAAQISELVDLNARIRTEGTRNLIEAARRSGSPKILAQSVAWQLPDGPDAQAVAELERSVLAEGGVVLRYGQFYGPGTYNEQQPPEEPRVHIDRAAERTVEALGEPTGVVVIIDRARDRDFGAARHGRQVLQGRRAGHRRRVSVYSPALDITIAAASIGERETGRGC